MSDGLFQPQDLEAPCPPEVASRYGIAVVGCGEVARTACLPAYRARSYRVEVACDVLPQRARNVAEDFAIPRWTSDLDTVLDDERVQVVDIAVRVEQRPALVHAVAAAGKHVLAQKPLAPTLAQAEEMVAGCDAAGVKLMVNHQARWAPGHRAAKLLLDRGVLGHLFSLLHVYRDWQDFPDSWFVAAPHATMFDHGIHYMDLTRFFTGRNPWRVRAATSLVPGQRAVSPMIYTIACEYRPAMNLMSTLHFNNIVSARSSHRYEWLLDGTEGSLRVTLAELHYHSARRPDRWTTVQLGGRWFPDAFGAAMGELLLAIAEDREPEASGRDNLDTLRLAFASIESSVTGRSIELHP
jgi:predicted dehydrogenase